MRTSWKTRRVWGVAGQVVAIAVMMLTGFLVSMLALLTTPENFEGTNQEIVSDLGALRFLIATLLLFLLPWYRKIPLALIISGGFYALILQGDPFVLAIGLTVWIVRASKPWHWVVTGLGLVIVVLNVGWHILALGRMPDDFEVAAYRAVVLTLGFLAITMILGIAFLTRQRRKTTKAHLEVESAEHDRDHISHQMTRQTEREFLAREVHDTLAQRLTALSLQTGQLQKQVQQADDVELTNALSATKRYSDQALRDLQTLVKTLRDHGEQEPNIPAVAPDGFQDLKILFEDAAQQGLNLELQILLNGYETAPENLQRAVLRITQEALTNVMRHSADQRVRIVCEGQPGEGLNMEFVNRPAVQEPFHDGTGTGLLGITERAELIGGSTEIIHQPDRFHLIVNLPWPVETVATS